MAIWQYGNVACTHLKRRATAHGQQQHLLRVLPQLQHTLGLALRVGQVAPRRRHSVHDDSVRPARHAPSSEREPRPLGRIGHRDEATDGHAAGECQREDEGRGGPVGRRDALARRVGRSWG
eukprot:6431749-Prymnesium_polylepis.1